MFTGFRLENYGSTKLKMNSLKTWKISFFIFTSGKFNKLVEAMKENINHEKKACKILSGYILLINKVLNS